MKRVYKKVLRLAKFHRVKEKFVKGSVIAKIPSCERKVSERLVIAQIPSCERKVRERLRDSPNSRKKSL
jgi:hypothetical protein